MSICCIPAALGCKTSGMCCTLIIFPPPICSNIWSRRCFSWSQTSRGHALSKRALAGLVHSHCSQQLCMQSQAGNQGGGFKRGGCKWGGQRQQQRRVGQLQQLADLQCMSVTVTMTAANSGHCLHPETSWPLPELAFTFACSPTVSECSPTMLLCLNVLYKNTHVPCPTYSWN